MQGVPHPSHAFREGWAAGQIAQWNSPFTPPVNLGLALFKDPATPDRGARPPNNDSCNNYRVISTRLCLFNHTRPPALSKTCNPAQRDLTACVFLTRSLYVRICTHNYTSTKCSTRNIVRTPGGTWGEVKTPPAARKPGRPAFLRSSFDGRRGWFARWPRVLLMTGRTLSPGAATPGRGSGLRCHPSRLHHPGPRHQPSPSACGAGGGLPTLRSTSGRAGHQTSS